MLNTGWIHFSSDLLPAPQPTLLCIFSWQGIKQNIHPPSPAILIFISIFVQTNRRGLEKSWLEPTWIVSLPGIKQDIFSIQLFWCFKGHLNFPHKLEIQGRTKMPKPPCPHPFIILQQVSFTIFSNNQALNIMTKREMLGFITNIVVLGICLKTKKMSKGNM